MNKKIDYDNLEKRMREVFEQASEECNEQCFEYQCYLYNIKGKVKDNDQI